MDSSLGPAQLRSPSLPACLPASARPAIALHRPGPWSSPRLHRLRRRGMPASSAAGLYIVGQTSWINSWLFALKFENYSFQCLLDSRNQTEDLAKLCSVPRSFFFFFPSLECVKLNAYCLNKPVVVSIAELWTSGCLRGGRGSAAQILSLFNKEDYCARMGCHDTPGTCWWGENGFFFLEATSSPRQLQCPSHQLRH